MKSILSIFVLLFTASFAYNEYGVEPKNFEIVRPQDHHWNTDYEAFRSYNPDPDFSLYALDNVPVEDLNIDKNFIIEKLQILSGEKSFILNGVEKTIIQRGDVAGRSLARDFLRSEYEKLGFTVSVVGNGGNINNFVAVREGQIKDKFIVLSSHLDSVNNSGADDNGTGTIINLAIAKAIQNHNLKYSLKIIAFDLEELYLLGSLQFVRDTDTSNILMNINVDMAGFDGNKDGAIHVIDCKNDIMGPTANSAPLKARVLHVLQTLNIPLKITKACTDRSDHAAFWKVNIPAILISENFFGKDGNPCYHKACDKTNLVDYDYVTSIARLSGSSVLSFLQGY